MAEVRTYNRTGKNRGPCRCNDGLATALPIAASRRCFSFQDLHYGLPLWSGPARLLRARGGDERELNIFELARRAHDPHSILSKEDPSGRNCTELGRALALPPAAALASRWACRSKRSGAGARHHRRRPAADGVSTRHSAGSGFAGDRPRLARGRRLGTFHRVRRDLLHRLPDQHSKRPVKRPSDV